MSTINYTIDLGVAGEFDCIVSFDYQPKESRTEFYPGCDESYEVYQVLTDSNNDITWLVADYLNDSAMFLDALHGEEE